MTADTPDATAGLGHEVKLLVDLVVEHSAPWLERVKATGPGPDDRAEGAGHADDRSETPGHQDPQTGSNCVGWCPLCAAVGVAKGQPPEFTAKAFEQAAQLVALLRAVLADRWHPEQGVHMPGFRPETSTAAADVVRADAPNATLGTSNAPNATLGTSARTAPATGNGQRSGRRVQHVAVRKATPADAGERQP